MLIINIYSLKVLKTLEDIHTNEYLLGNQSEWIQTKKGEEKLISQMESKHNKTLAINSQLECENTSLKHEIDKLEKSLEVVEMKVYYTAKIQRENLYHKFALSKNIPTTAADELIFKTPTKTSSKMSNKRYLVSKERF